MTTVIGNPLRPANDGNPWTRDQIILALELYCRIPFSKTKASNPLVIELATLLRRTPASVARKLGNFGAFDPQLAIQKIVGLSHGSKLDRQVWNEFQGNWSELTDAAFELRCKLSVNESSLPTYPLPPAGPSTRLVTVEQRRHQSFFRDAVLSSYESKCCITSLAIPECLVASHIIPWSQDECRRTQPTNGLCFSATFDRLFDSGLLTLDDQLRVVIHRSLLHGADNATTSLIANWHGHRINTPTRFAPDRECLRWHREHVFVP